METVFILLGAFLALAIGGYLIGATAINGASERSSIARAVIGALFLMSGVAGFGTTIVVTIVILIANAIL